MNYYIRIAKIKQPYTFPFTKYVPYTKELLNFFNIFLALFSRFYSNTIDNPSLLDDQDNNLGIYQENV